MIEVPKYMRPEIKVQVDDMACVPARAHASDAGADLIAVEETYLYKGTRTLVKTGVRAAIPLGYVGLLFPRSSLSKRGITMTNSVGVIDTEYRGEIMASLIYNGPADHAKIEKGDRVVQLLVVPIILPEFVVSESLDETARGAGGFGSTGV